MNRILNLINLLNSRECVSLKMIMETCGIPKRTAYRYLNVISEANVPVYFDREIGGYTLSNRTSPGTYAPTLSEILLIVLSLKSLSQNLNEEYRKDIQELVVKIITHQSDPIEEVLPFVDAILPNNQHGSDMSHLVTSAIIRAAIVCKKKPRIFVTDSSLGKRSFQVKNPSLQFQENWHLAEKNNVGRRGTDVSNILKASID